MLEKTIGIQLQRRRKETGVSAEALALRLGMAPSTLYRWESGKSSPRLPELLAVLEALEVPKAQWSGFITLIQSPQAAAHLRERADLPGPAIEGWTSWMPVPGELWRALRIRGRMTGKQVAERLRIHPSAVTRWERSQSAPPDDRLDDLLTLLGAYPEERAFLADRRLHLLCSLADDQSSLESWEEAIETLHGQVGTVARLPADLLFMVAEGRLWTLAGGSARALRLLALAYTYHADYLMWHERLPEMARYAERAQAILKRLHHPESFHLTAIGHSAHYAWRTDYRRGAHRALNIYSAAAELAETSSASISFYRNLAEYTESAGLPEEALGWIARSRQGALRYEDAGALRLGNIIHARILLRAGRAAEAVPLLATDDHIMPYQHMFEQLLWAETLLELGDRPGATDWLSRFFALVEEYDLEHHRWQGEAIARRL